MSNNIFIQGKKVNQARAIIDYGFSLDKIFLLTCL